MRKMNHRKMKAIKPLHLEITANKKVPMASVILKDYLLNVKSWNLKFQAISLRMSVINISDCSNLSSIHAVKNIIRDVTVDMLSRSKEDMAITTVAAEFARTASSNEWVHFFDVLLGMISSLSVIRTLANVVKTGLKTGIIIRKLLDYLKLLISIKSCIQMICKQFVSFRRFINFSTSSNPLHS